METKEQTKEIKEKVIIGLTKTYEKLLEMKRKNNGVLVMSKNGKIVRLNPNDL